MIYLGKTRKIFGQNIGFFAGSGSIVVRALNLFKDYGVGSIRKELLSRLNQMYYRRSFCKTNEHYNY
jgi:hypothetical protein